MSEHRLQRTRDAYSGCWWWTQAERDEFTHNVAIAAKVLREALLIDVIKISRSYDTDFNVKH